MQDPESGANSLVGSYFTSHVSDLRSTLFTLTSHVFSHLLLASSYHVLHLNLLLRIRKVICIPEFLFSPLISFLHPSLGQLEASTPSSFASSTTHRSSNLYQWRSRAQLRTTQAVTSRSWELPGMNSVLCPKVMLIT